MSISETAKATNGFKSPSLICEAATLPRLLRKMRSDEIEKAHGCGGELFAAAHEHARVDGTDRGLERARAHAPPTRHRAARQQRHDRDAEPRFHHADDRLGARRFE